MKVQSSTNSQQEANAPGKTSKLPVKTNATEPEGNERSANHLDRAGRQFASVLDEVAHARERRGSGERGDKGDDEGGEQRDNKSTARSARERETERSQEKGNDAGGSGGSFAWRGEVREAASEAAAPAARSMLHIADLERIVASVRTQVIAGGHRQVTLELQRSVLAGLRVRLSADEAGRVTAEFVAANERVRSQIDARSGELAELLRSRGVNLAGLRATIDSSVDGNTGDGAERRAFSAERNMVRENSAFVAGREADDEFDTVENAAADISTYRA